MLRKSITLAAAAAVATLALAAPSLAAQFRWEFTINELTQGDVATFDDQISGSFLLDDTTPVDFGPNNDVVEDFAFTLDTPDGLGIDAEDFRISGGIRRGAESFTISNSLGNPGNTLFLEFNREDEFLELAVLRIPGDATFNSRGVAAGVNTVSVSAIPLPAAGWLMGLGLAGLMTLRRRKAA